MTRSTPFRVGAIAILVAVLALRLWSVGQWSWMYDDWVYMERTRSMGFFAFLFQNYNGHLMPGEFLVVWIVTKLAPLSHPVVMIGTAVAATAATGIWAFALRELCGERLRTLVPLMLVGLTPLQIQGTIWWSAALQTVSVQMALGGCVYFAVRLARRGRRFDRVGLLLTFLAGLLMFEKAVLLLIPIAAVLAYLIPRSAVGHRRRLLGEYAWLGLVAAAYTALYIGLVQRPSTAPTPVSFAWKPLGEVTRSFGDLVGHLLAPGILGGPWGTLPTESHVLAQPGGLQVAITVSLLVGGTILALATRRWAWLPPAMVIAFGVVSWGLVVLSSRLEILGLTRVGYERYAADIFLVMCLALSLYLSPEARRPGPSRFRLRPGLSGLSERRITVLVVLALFGSLALADVTAVRRIGVSPAREWVRNVTSDVDRLGPVSVVDAVAPDDVLFGPFWGEHARLSRMLTPLADQVRFDRPASPLYVVSPKGRLEPMVVGTAVRSKPGPVADCGYALGPGSVQRIPMTGKLYAYRWGVQVSAFAGQPGKLVLEVDGREIPIAIRAGLNAPQAILVGTVDDVRFRSESGSEVVCITDLVIGPVAESSPD